MPTHLSFAFGIGNFFNFKFEYCPRELSPPRSDPRSAISDYEIARVGHSFQHGLGLSTNESEEVGLPQLQNPSMGRTSERRYMAWKFVTPGHLFHESSGLSTKYDR